MDVTQSVFYPCHRLQEEGDTPPFGEKSVRDHRVRRPHGVGDSVAAISAKSSQLLSTETYPRPLACRPGSFSWLPLAAGGLLSHLSGRAGASQCRSKQSPQATFSSSCPAGSHCSRSCPRPHLTVHNPGASGEAAWHSGEKLLSCPRGNQEPGCPISPCTPASYVFRDAGKHSTVGGRRCWCSHWRACPSAEGGRGSPRG